MRESDHRPAHSPDIRAPWAETFWFAAKGILYTVAHERNMRIHMSVALSALLFCLVVRPGLGIVAMVALLCFLVFAAETFNTAVEALVDLATQGKTHPLAKIAKDAAAGGVLLTAIGSCCVGCYAVADTYPWRFLLFTTVHPLAALMALVLFLGLIGFSTVASRVHRQADPNDSSTMGRRRRPE